MSVSVASLLFDPTPWITKAGGNLAVARYYQNQMAPLSGYSSLDFGSFDSKLALLPDAQMQLLGFTCAIAPFIGTIGTNLNGSFRRAVKSRLCGERIAQLDQLTGHPLPTFLLPPDSWADPDAIALAAIAAVLDCAKPSAPAKAICDFRFERTAPAVASLTISLVEVLCQISLPTAQWLYVAP